MSIQEMKKNIKTQIEQLSENQLNELQEFIDKINVPPVKEYDLMPHAEIIMKDREEVLKKLAQ